jgi:hypothetical protein
MRYAVLAASAILTITALCDMAEARGAVGVGARGGARPLVQTRASSAYRHFGFGGWALQSHRTGVVGHFSRGPASHLSKRVGWRYSDEHGWRRDQHTWTNPQPAPIVEFVPSSPFRFLADEPGRYLGSGAF